MRARVLLMPGWTLFEQLAVEESLMRSSQEMWLLLSRPALPAPCTVVMGANAKPHEVLNVNEVLARSAPVIRRFSGGGTVAVDEGITLTSVIGSTLHVTDAGRFPPEIMRWSERLYKPAFARIGSGMHLLEHDYCIGQQKIGGNAQALARDRWVHHTSWIWDIHPSSLRLLTVPPKTPAYREERDHDSFVARVKDLAPAAMSRGRLERQVLAAMLSQFEPVGEGGQPLFENGEGPNEMATSLWDAALGLPGASRFLQAALQAARTAAEQVHAESSARKSNKVVSLADLQAAGSRR
ncbi:hypothetical protein FNF31_05193 [Cafeteria roenbergensis]|uniref:BPL/LPL catalytic domain-containing protein n=1 Tax=Cafeteria roenbergensis TaxID=33653 RepID=A0A5A8D4D7_CAFRO|nr:hypothetical protein FNF31_05193 [Cafeteria roenbergensis]